MKQFTPKAAEPAATPQTTPPGLAKIDFAARRANRRLPTAKLLALLKDSRPHFYERAEVVGQWVWIAFNEIPPRPTTAQLSELGFHWNTRRQLWQHPCGTMSEGHPRDPRAKYRSYFPARKEAV